MEPHLSARTPFWGYQTIHSLLLGHPADTPTLYPWDLMQVACLYPTIHAHCLSLGCLVLFMLHPMLPPSHYNRGYPCLIFYWTTNDFHAKLCLEFSNNVECLYFYKADNYHSLNGSLTIPILMIFFYKKVTSAFKKSFFPLITEEHFFKKINMFNKSRKHIGTWSDVSAESYSFTN